MDADAIVIGAGYAGLAAADHLIQNGLRPLIIESRDRVGGRTHTVTAHQGIWLDLGGQWIGPGQDHVYGLADRFQRDVWPMHTQGRQVIEVAGKIKTFRGLIPMNLPPLALANLLWAFYRLEWMARSIPLDQPWNTKNAFRLDEQTVGDWLRRNAPHPSAQAILKVAIEAVFASHPDDIGLLHALYYLKSGGGLERLTSSAGGAQQDRIQGGLQTLAEDWARWIQEKKTDILFELPVRAIDQDAAQVRVETDRGTFRAPRVVVTVPPAIAAEIEFRPEMPSERFEWCRAMQPGRVIKGFAFYSSPFWRQRGLCGQAVSDQPPVHVAFDATPPSSPCGVLLGFIEGRQALEWSQRAQDERRQAMIQAFTRFFGSEASQPLFYIDHDWTQETWSRGCYAGVPGPGVTTTVAFSARQPHRRVHWAGTETAVHWNGYVEGAIRSGLRAAEEICRV